MAGIRPIGSEKLEGMDKIRRIMEIARYNENIPQSVNETKSTEYSISLADGNMYRIEKERQGYIIKLAINESESDYIENMKARKYYSSYSQALKRLNLMTKEINTLYENEEGTSLIGEQKKKYVLKTPKPKTAPEAEMPAPEMAPPPEAAPAPAPAPDMAAAAPAPEMAPAPEVAEQGVPAPPVEGEMPPPPVEGEMPPVEGEMPPVEGEMPPPPEGEIEGEEMEIDVESKPKEKKVSDLKRIQILVGKLAQKIRSYNEDKELSAENVKYVINSILSALDVDVLDEDDLEEIISKLEGGDEDEGSEEDFEMEDEEMSGEEMTGDEMVPPPPSPEESQPEMAEEYSSYGEAFRDYLPSAYGNVAMRGMQGEKTESTRHHSDSFDDDLEVIDFDEVEEDEYHRERRRGRKNYPDVDRFEHGTFSESVVDGVLSKYFVASKTEINDFKLKQKKKTNENYNKNRDSVIKLSESAEQLDAALEFIEENPRTHLIGISNKKTLIFKNGINEVRITDDGFII